MKQISSVSEYQDIVDKYSRKGVSSNDYLLHEVNSLVKNHALYAVCSDDNSFLFVKKDIGYRVYYYINDFNHVVDFRNFQNLVVEVLFRKDIPQKEIEYLQQCGFCTNLIRDQYSATYKDLQHNNCITNIKFVEAQDIEQVKLACTLFNSSFDKLSGDYILETAYYELLQNHAILLAVDVRTQKILGALHQKRERGVNWIAHIAIFPEARGCGIGTALVQSFVARNYTDDNTRYMLWVQRNNQSAVQMYQRLGFKYISKSTISLIKY